MSLFAPMNVAQACEVLPVSVIELEIYKCMTSHFSADKSKLTVFKFSVELSAKITPSTLATQWPTDTLANTGPLQKC